MSSLFSRTANREQAIEVLGYASRQVLLLSALAAAVGSWVLGPGVVIVAVTCVALGLAMHRYRSRVAALALALVSLAAFVATFLIPGPSDHTSVAYVAASVASSSALFVFLLGARGVEATLKLHG